MPSFSQQRLDPARTTWHVTWGTYGTRLHGGAAATVDRLHNQRGAAFLQRDPLREEHERALMKHDPVALTEAQRDFIEDRLPAICDRGGWTYRIAAAASDHIHVLCDIVPEVHGEKVRRLLKRWLGQELSERWPLPPGARWWAVEGSNRAIHEAG